MGGGMIKPWENDRAITQSVRFIFAAALSAGIIRSEAVSQYIQRVWTSACEHPVIRHDSCEPLIASFSFMLSVVFFRLLDRVPWMIKYKMHPEELAIASEQDLTPPRHAVYSLLAYLGPLFMFDVLLPRRALPIQAPCLSRLVFEVLLSLIVYDFLFFWLHLAFHKIGGVNRLVRHQQHHSKTPLDATQVVNHSLLDGTLQVATNIVTLNLLGSHPLSRILHNIVITFLLTEIHSGFDFPWMLHKVIPFGILGGPPAHELHHRMGSCHYQQFFTYLDSSLGFTQEGSRICVCSTKITRLVLWGNTIVLAVSVISVYQWSTNLSHRSWQVKRVSSK